MTAPITVEAKAIRKAGLEPVAVDAPAFALIRAACGGDIPSDRLSAPSSTAQSR